MSEFRRRLLVQSKNDNPILDNYLTIVALEDGLTAKLSLNACEYCVDGNGNWKTLPANTATEPINAGQTLSFRGNLTPAASVGIGTFTVNKYYNLKGNCMSLLFGDEGKTSFSLVAKSNVFRNLFKNNDRLINVSSSFLPATTLSSICYFGMFEGCTSLTQAPVLPATTLADYCYYYMFKNCSSFVEAPQLPATELKLRCYANMFEGCSSLVEAPQLPATTLVSLCYERMFSGCSKLNKITMLATKISEAICLNNWTSSVANSGIFVKSSDLSDETIGYGSSGIPTGWTVINYIE